MHRLHQERYFNLGMEMCEGQRSKRRSERLHLVSPEQEMAI